WMLGQLWTGYEVRFEGLVINNARRIEDFSAGPKRGLILAAGRLWDPAKNLAALDAAAEQLPWPVLVAGQAHDPQIGPQDDPQASGAAVANVELLGALPSRELAGWMAQASIFAHPAR